MTVGVTVLVYGCLLQGRKEKAGIGWVGKKQGQGRGPVPMCFCLILSLLYSKIFVCILKTGRGRDLSPPLSIPSILLPLCLSSLLLWPLSLPELSTTSLPYLSLSTAFYVYNLPLF